MHLATSEVMKQLSYDFLLAAFYFVQCIWYAFGLSPSPAGESPYSVGNEAAPV